MMPLVTGNIHSQSNYEIGLKTQRVEVSEMCDLNVLLVLFSLLGTVFAITSVCHLSLDERSVMHASIKPDKLSIAGHTRGFSARSPKENTSRRNAVNAHNKLYFGDSDSAGRYFAIILWNVWDGLIVRVGIIIFHLFFILILLERAR